MAYKNTSYKKIPRCQNCGSVMLARLSFGFPVLTCYPCEYTIDHRGRAAYHIIEICAHAYNWSDDNLHSTCAKCGKVSK